MTNYKLSGDNKGESLVVIYDGEDPVTVPGTHPKFDEILALLRGGEAHDDEVELLVNEGHAMARKLSFVTERVSVTPYAAFFDGDPLNPAMTSVILDLYNEGKEEGLEAVANFLDKASQNASMASVEALYQWIKNGDLVLKPNGNFVAYKGVQKLNDGSVTSISKGTAWVDGVRHTGAIPNPVGSVISMPRAEVDANGQTHCSTGLHAGTYDYASGFAQGALLLVEINPRDVVSVPDDFTFSKLRVSRYTVLEHIEHRLESRWYVTVEHAEDDYCFEEPEDDGDFTEDGPVDATVTDEEPQTFFGLRNQPIVVTGSISTEALGKQIDATVNAVTKTLEDAFGRRGTDGKFVKGGTVKMKRDENGKFVGKKKSKKDKKGKKNK